MDRMQLLTDPLVLPIVFPLVMGLVCRLLPRRLEGERGAVAVGSAAGTLFLGWQLFRGVRALPSGLALETSCCSLVNLLRLDHLGSFVLLAITFFGFIIAMYSLSYMREHDRLGEYYAYLLWTVGISCGAVLANHLVLLLVCWGLLGITLYVMIGIAGAGAADAAKKSFIIIGGSDCFLMLGVVIAWHLRGSARMDTGQLPLTGELGYVALFCFVLAALAKAGAMPVHTWVPDCGEKAPVPVAALLPASLDKLLGIYLLARTVRDLFEMNGATNGVLMFIGAGTVICGVMMALVQHDLKRLLSYHAVSQVGYMVLGIASGTLVGLAGGLFHMLNNAIYKSALFMCAGAVEKKTGTTDLDRLGGLAKAMPMTFASCLIAALAISGIPPLNGFTSKWLVYQGIVESGKAGSQLWVIWLGAAMLGSALTLASFVKVLHAVFLRKRAPGLAGKEIGEVGRPMWIPTAVLASLCVVFGVVAFPVPLSKMIYPAVRGLVLLSGSWRSADAAVLLLAAYGLGMLVYFVTTARKPRECETYIGGEIMDEAYVAGTARGSDRDLEVTGADFYLTVENLFLLKGLYAGARKKMFDLYDVGRAVVFYLVGALRSAHSGRLPTYLTWFLLGLLGVLWVLVFGARLI